MIYDTTNKKYDECILNIDQILLGNYNELKVTVNTLKDYTIKVLVGLKMTKKDDVIKIYHSTYTKYYMKHNQESYTNFKNQVEKDEYTAFNVDHFTWDINCYKQHEAAEYAKLPDEDKKNEETDF